MAAIKAARAAVPEQPPIDPAAHWPTSFHWNGVAVYREPTASGAIGAATGGAHPAAGGALATVCTMAARPAAVFEHLVRLDDGRCAWPLFERVRVLEAAGADGSPLVRPPLFSALPSPHKCSVGIIAPLVQRACVATSPWRTAPLRLWCNVPLLQRASAVTRLCCTVILLQRASGAPCSENLHALTHGSCAAGVPRVAGMQQGCTSQQPLHAAARPARRRARADVGGVRRGRRRAVDACLC